MYSTSAKSSDTSTKLSRELMTLLTTTSDAVKQFSSSDTCKINCFIDLVDAAVCVTVRKQRCTNTHSVSPVTAAGSHDLVSAHSVNKDTLVDAKEVQVSAI